MNAGIGNDPRSQRFSSYSGLLLALLLGGASVPTPQQGPVNLKAEERTAFELEGQHIYALAFTADANGLACVCFPPPGHTPGEVRLWHRMVKGSGEATLATSLPDTKGVVNALALSPDGWTLATGGAASADLSDKRSREGVVKLWDTASGKERAVFKENTPPVATLKFSPDGKVLAATTDSSKGVSGGIELKLWDVTGRKELATIPGHGHSENMLEFTPDGKTLAWGTQGIYQGKGEPEIKLIDVVAGKELANLKGHAHVLKCLAFSPDGKTLASAGGVPPARPTHHSRGRTIQFREEPGQLKLWEVATGKERANLQGHKGCVLSLAFSPDGKTLASGSAGAPMPDGPPKRELWYWSGEVKLWDVTTGKERVALRGHPIPRGTVECVTFSADGTTLASAGGNMVKLWDTASGRERAEVTGDRSDTWLWVAFKENGMILLSHRPEPARIFGTAHEGLTFWDVPAVKEHKSPP